MASDQLLWKYDQKNKNIGKIPDIHLPNSIGRIVQSYISHILPFERELLKKTLFLSELTYPRHGKYRPIVHLKPLIGSDYWEIKNMFPGNVIIRHTNLLTLILVKVTGIYEKTADNFSILGIISCYLMPIKLNDEIYTDEYNKY